MKKAFIYILAVVASIMVCQFIVGLIIMLITGSY